MKRKRNTLILVYPRPIIAALYWAYNRRKMMPVLGIV